MPVTEMLRKDHEIVRRKLEFLEQALPAAACMPFALREMCHSLARLLREHIRREEEAIAPYAAYLEPGLRAREIRDHADQQVVLRWLNDLLLLGVKTPTSTVVTRLTTLITRLREHMAGEERDVFPLVDQAEAACGRRHAAISPMIEPSMSANAVMKAFPRTKAVFTQHGIECGCEGCDCLDELAWRHGLDADALLSELRASAGAPPPGNAADGASFEAAAAPDDEWPEASSGPLVSAGASP